MMTIYKTTFSEEEKKILSEAKDKIKTNFDKLLHKENSKYIKKFEKIFQDSQASIDLTNMWDTKNDIAITFRDILKIYFKDINLDDPTSNENDIEVHTTQYEYDLELSLRLYDCLSFLELPQRILNQDSFWIFLTLAVIPDIVYQRWSRSKAIEDRFYKKKNRIWLKTAWWYIHLTWQGDFNKTKKTIEKFSIDCIVQLVERSGNGYDIDLYRAISQKLASSSSPTFTLRKVMKLNTARSLNFIYILDRQSYVEGLFQKAETNLPKEQT
jgi:hypothetical protein